MKSKPQSTRVAKTPTLRKSAINSPPPARNGNRNGDGNGHATGPRSRKTTSGSPSRREVLDGQPPIHQILAAAAPEHHGEDAHGKIDKALLLNALLALRKGDFTVRLPVDHE